MAAATFELGPHALDLAAAGLAGATRPAGASWSPLPGVVGRMVTDRPRRSPLPSDPAEHRGAPPPDERRPTTRWRAPRCAVGPGWPRLPLGFAGRATLGLGKRSAARSAERVNAELQERAAEQLFKVLGELKGGAMKFGQTLSLFEAVLPEDIAKPYREHLTRLQDSAPPMPTSRVHAVLARELGAGLEDDLVELDPRPAAAASIGQVHRGVWRDGRTVAVKVQYPGADEALRSDLRQIGRLSKVIAPLAGGMDVKPLVEEMTARISEELDYTLEADHQQQAADGFAGHPEFVVPARAGLDVAGDGQRVDRGSAAVHGPGRPRPSSATRSGCTYVRFLFAGPQHGRAAACRPAPGELQGAGRRAAGGGRLRSGRPAARRTAGGDGPDPADRRDGATPTGARRAEGGGLRRRRRRRRTT